jgi:phospholipid/cholesterol/gamma-HCH transport system ATP-binding protein
MEQTAAHKKESHTGEKPVLTVEGLNKTFGENHVLRDFNVELFANENLVVIGKSGSGKSVLIKCIIGLVRPDKGKITVFDTDVTNLSPDELDPIRVKVGFLFQTNALYDSMTIRENLEFPLRRHGLGKSKDEIESLVKEALDSVDLAKTIDQMPSELSGGMKKRIAIARTLILKPEIILYDEPTTGLDSVTSREISELMVEVQKKYKTASIIISHDLNCVRITANRIAVLIDGQCYTTGTYEEMTSSEDPKVKQFFI